MTSIERYVAQSTNAFIYDVVPIIMAAILER